MRLEVLLFASLRDALGPSVVIEVAETSPGETSPAALRKALEEAHPAVKGLGRRALVAVNQTYAGEADPIRAGDEVALLPPVAGG